MMPWLLCGLGLVILLLAGDALVRGAVNLSLRLGVPALIVSLTIVAFGTSAPELLIAIKAVADNADGIALGNVVGSNTANILMVLGIPAIIATLHTSGCDSRKSYVLMLMASVLFIGLAMCGTLTIWSGLILLTALALFWRMRSVTRVPIVRIAVETKKTRFWTASKRRIPPWRCGRSASTSCLA